MARGGDPPMQGRWRTRERGRKEGWEGRKGKQWESVGQGVLGRTHQPPTQTTQTAAAISGGKQAPAASAARHRQAAARARQRAVAAQASAKARRWRQRRRQQQQQAAAAAQAAVAATGSSGSSSGGRSAAAATAAVAAAAASDSQRQPAMVSINAQHSNLPTCGRGRGGGEERLGRAGRGENPTNHVARGRGMRSPKESHRMEQEPRTESRKEPPPPHCRRRRRPGVTRPQP